MAGANLENISGFEPLSEKAEACYGAELLSFHLDLPLDTIGAVCDLLFFSALIATLYLVQILSRLSINTSSSCSS